MPIVNVSVAKGKTEEQLRSLISAIHDAVETHIQASRDGTTVIITEIEPRHWSRGDVTIQERRQTE